MTRAEQLAFVCRQARPAGHSTPLEKQAWIGGLAAAGRAGWGLVKGLGPQLARAGNGLRDTGRAVRGWGGWTKQRHLPGFRPKPPPHAGAPWAPGHGPVVPTQPWSPTGGQYSRGLQTVNKGMDKFFGNFGRPGRFMRGASQFILPTSWMRGAQTVGMLGMGVNQLQHPGDLTRAGEMGAARALYEVNRNPLTSGLGAAFGSPESVARKLQESQQPGVARYFHDFSQGGQRAIDQAARGASFSAVLPFY